VFAILFFYPFVRSDIRKKVYIRLSFCFIAFWVGYYILPVFLFAVVGQPPTEFDLSTVYNPWVSAIGYYLTVFLNVIAIFIRTLMVLPFAFLLAPMISVVILWLSLRGEKGSFREKMDELSYRFESDPLQRVRNRLMEKGWKEEKEMFKLMIVFLPISLWLLTLILTIMGQGGQAGGIVNVHISTFVEDLVAYLSSFLVAVYLLYSSKLSFRSRSIGDRIRFSINRYLLTTGTILAVFSIIAFAVQFSQSWSTMAYFLIHYTMMSVIFAILLPFLEPFGSLLFIKIINFIKGSKTEAKRRSFLSRKSLLQIIAGFAVASISLLISYSISTLTRIESVGNAFEDYLHLRVEYCRIGAVPPPTFSQELDYIRLFMIFSLQDVLMILVVAFILVWLVRQLNSQISGTILSVAFFSTLYQVVLILLGSEGGQLAGSLIPAPGPYTWVTAIPAVMTAPNFSLPASRLGTLEVTGSALDGAMQPFLSLSPLLLVVFLAYWVRYWRAPLYITRTIGEDTITEKAFSRLSLLPSLDELKDSPENFVFKGNGAGDSGILKNISPERRRDAENVQALLAKREPVTFSVLAKSANVEKKVLYAVLRYLVYARLVEVDGLEFTSVTHKPALQSLYVTTREGLSIFDYSFGSLTIEPTLVSGMLTAITSFVKEATRSKQFLRTVEHGDVVLVVEYGNNVFATMVADQETPDLRIGLRQFIQEFEKRHASILADWTGAMPNVEKDKELAEKIFKQY
jgi:hypothetical protein